MISAFLRPNRCLLSQAEASVYLFVSILDASAYICHCCCNLENHDGILKSYLFISILNFYSNPIIHPTWLVSSTSSSTIYHKNKVGMYALHFLRILAET